MVHSCPKLLLEAITLTIHPIFSMSISRLGSIASMFYVSLLTISVGEVVNSSCKKQNKPENTERLFVRPGPCIGDIFPSSAIGGP